jgi:hypothetical protein
VALDLSEVVPMTQRVKLSLLACILAAVILWAMLGTYTRRGSLQHAANRSDTVSKLLAPAPARTRP